jgi:hypothetical protein
MDLAGHPANGMGKSLKNNDPSKPAMNQVHGVEGDSGKLDDRVVASSKKEERDHVDNRHNTCTAEKLAGALGEVTVINSPETESDVDGKVPHEEEGLQAARKSSNTDSGGHLELAVMARPEEGRIEAGLLEAGVPKVGDGKVSLCLVAET